MLEAQLDCHSVVEKRKIKFERGHLVSFFMEKIFKNYANVLLKVLEKVKKKRYNGQCESALQTRA